MAPSLPLRRTRDLTVQHVGDETLLYCERTHQAFCLNAITAAVWNACDGTRTPHQIATLISPETESLTGEAVVRLALCSLKKDNLIEGFLTDELAGVSRRAMLLQGGAGLALMLPAIAIIAAPKAAQAYSGCFNCSATSASQQRHRAQAIEQQQNTKQTPAKPF